MSVVFAVCGAAFATWAARVPAVAQHLGLTTAAMALGLFGLAAGSIVGLLAAGPLVTKVGSRWGVLVGASLLCGGLPTVALAPGRWTLVVALVLFGAGNSLLDVSMNAHAARVEQAYLRPIFAGFHAFWNIGGLLGSALSSLLAARQVPIQVHFSPGGRRPSPGGSRGRDRLSPDRGPTRGRVGRRSRCRARRCSRSG